MKSKSQFLQAESVCLVGSRLNQSDKRPWCKEVQHTLLPLLATVIFRAMSVDARSQSLPPLEDSLTPSGIAVRGYGTPAYVRPAERTKIRNCAFDAFGPYPIAGAAVKAGIDQSSNSPPEWNQGLKGFSRRFGSNFAIATVGTTTRYGLAEAFKEDTLYYRCECRGSFPRLRHAVISTLTERRGDNGRRVFSFSALAAPYAGSMTAVFGWYPKRFGAKDAFRMGNYSLVEYMGGNIALEFLFSGPHSMLSRMHLNSAHGSPLQGPNR